MAKSKECEIIFNTKYGYVMKPIMCKSISKEICLAKEYKMAYRIFIDNKCVKSGWM